MILVLLGCVLVAKSSKKKNAKVVLVSKSIKEIKNVKIFFLIYVWLFNKKKESQI